MNRSRARFACLLLAMLLATTLAAQAQDSIGIFFDPEFTQSQITVDTAPTLITGYLVLQDPSTGYPVHGWECCVGLDGDATFTDWQLEGLTINVGTPPCFVVGIGGDPLPGTGNVLLATFQVLINTPTPVVFSLEPTQYPSIPGEMAYLSGPSGYEELPMYPVTGYPEVASINEDSPWPEVSTTQLFFDLQPIGTTTLRTVTVSNVGGGYLHINASLPDDVTDFSLPGFHGDGYIYSGDFLTIQVAFTPSQVGEITATLDLGPNVPSVALHGVGREAIVSWDLVYDLDFPDVGVGVDVARQVTIQNTGEVPLTVTPSLDESCAGFYLGEGSTSPLQILPGLDGTLVVHFQPPYAGDFACDLQLGEPIGSLPMTGSGHDAVTSFNVTPSSLDFGEVVATTSANNPFVIQNTGETGIMLDISLDDPVGYYHLDLNPGQYNLQPGNSLIVPVIFAPQVAGQFDATVLLGDVVPPVPLTGTAIPATSGCTVNPTEIVFGSVNIGSTLIGYFNVSNTGNVPLVIAPSDNSEHFHVSANPQTILPGGTNQFTVYFQPQAEGFLEGDISLGESACQPVHCSGTGLPQPPPGDDNLVGIFFDSPYYADIHGYIESPGLIEAYLVLKQPALDLGVLGWECRHTLDGPAFFLGAVLSGNSINVGTFPDFVVGLAEPLPPTPDVLLATFNYFVPDVTQEITLFLDPASIPSIPGQMAFLADDYETLLPMYSVTGYRTVAFINSGMVGASRPAEPVLSANGGMVQLAWDAPAGDYDGFHVYRRDETGSETRLTTRPGSLGDDRVVFTDQPTGFETGSVLYYSYTLLSGGTESARSLEVEYEVQNVVVRATRLLPNVPNPFNPQTRIRFEVAQAGPVRVSIFDVSGRLVRTLEAANLTTGSHERVWQGKDNSGRQVPSGAYYVRLVTPDGTDNRKIMLLK